VSLKNKRILVTRPRHQSDRLCELISKANGIAILFPTIEIKAILSSEKLSACFDNINQYDFVIFVSRNAVRVVFENYLNESQLPNHIQVLAIGAGTAVALSEANMMDVLNAGIQADSESLLQIPELAGEHVNNKRILIVRGVGGRELLADTLKERGATVEYAEVYQRHLPEYEIQECHEVWQNSAPDAVIVSSNEGLENLLKLTEEKDRKQLFNTPLVVMSERNEKLAKSIGFVSKVEIANTKNDEGLLSAVFNLVGDKQT
jgi:uroporphyrinogen-III synthase